MPRTARPPAAQPLPPLHRSWVRQDVGEPGSQAELSDAGLAPSATTPLAETLPSAALPAPVQRASLPALPRPAGPVLLAFDGSPGAHRAIAEAAVLLGGAPVLVVHVWWPLDVAALSAGARLPGVLPPSAELQAEHDGAAERAAWELAADGAALAAERGLDARPRAIAAPQGASLAQALAPAALELDASVLVVAERRRPWPSRLLGRSPARELAGAAPCPVLVVPEPAGAGSDALLASPGARRAVA